MANGASELKLTRIFRYLQCGPVHDPALVNLAERGHAAFNSTNIQFVTWTSSSFSNLHLSPRVLPQATAFGKGGRHPAHLALAGLLLVPALLSQASSSIRRDPVQTLEKQLQNQYLELSKASTFDPITVDLRGLS